MKLHDHTLISEEEMTDIVKELRSRKGPERGFFGTRILCDEAANEIEMLRAALDSLLRRGAVLTMLEDDERENLQALLRRKK